MYSKHATKVQLVLFDDVDDVRPARTIDLTGRSYHYWHGFLPGVGHGQLYGFRAHGPFDSLR